MKKAIVWICFTVSLSAILYQTSVFFINRVIDKRIESAEPHDVVQTGSLDYVQRAFFKVGLDANRRDKDGQTPLFDAVQKNRPDILKVLISSGADPSLENSHGLTVLQYAERIGATTEVIEILQARLGLQGR